MQKRLHSISASASIAALLAVGVASTRSIEAKTRHEAVDDEGVTNSAPAPVAAPLPSRVELFTPDRPDTAGVLHTCADRVFSDAPSHLAVFKDGVCIFDRGLRRVSAQTTHEKTGVIEETGLVDTPFVAPDGRGALIGMLRFTDRLQLGANEIDDENSSLHPNTTLTWIDPSSPQGSFEVELEPGRVVKDAEALALGFGVAVMTQIHDEIDADFRLYNLSGKLLFEVPETEASATSITAADLGGFVMVDLALVSLPGGPDRALRVYDLLQGKSWQYAWAYGSDEEPLSWNFTNAGELIVRLPDKTLQFDRTGRLHAGSKSSKEPKVSNGERRGGLFNRIRN